MLTLKTFLQCTPSLSTTELVELGLALLEWEGQVSSWCSPRSWMVSDLITAGSKANGPMAEIIGLGVDGAKRDRD